MLLSLDTRINIPDTISFENTPNFRIKSARSKRKANMPSPGPDSPGLNHLEGGLIPAASS